MIDAATNLLEYPPVQPGRRPTSRPANIDPSPFTRALDLFDEDVGVARRRSANCFVVLLRGSSVGHGELPGAARREAHPPVLVGGLGAPHIVPLGIPGMWSGHTERQLELEVGRNTIWVGLGGAAASSWSWLVRTKVARHFLTEKQERE